MTADAPPRNEGLDFLRGTCALGVATHHYLNWTYNISLQSLGRFGVYTFFVLSAVTMMIRYDRDFRETISFTSLVTFYRNRAARILPLLAAVAIYAFVTSGGSSGDPLWRTLLTASGLFALQMPGLLSTTVGAWSLGIELLFYAGFPALALISSNVSTKTISIGCVVLIIGQQILLAQLPPTSAPAFWGEYTMPLTFAPFFALGLLAYRWKASATLGNAVLAGLALVSVLLFSALFPLDLLDGGPPYVCVMLGSAIAVALAYRSILPGVAARVGTFFGEVSYSLYLTHWIAYGASAIAPTALRPLVFAAFALTLASAVTYFFERPMARLLRARLPSTGRKAVAGP